MKLLRYGPAGQERPAMLDAQGRVRDLSGHVADFRDEVLNPDRLEALKFLDSGLLPLVEGSPRLGPPVAGIGKILGIGLNYRSHVEETGATPGAEPLVFSKAITALNGPNDCIMIPLDSVKTDWEVELAIVIGATARYVKEPNALDYVAGYAVINDVSERSFQKERG
jgi:2,4-diketo-3-deoxy-L-fuconate hydrolase